MKAIVQHRYGPPNALALEETGRPATGDDDVLIRVHAAGVSYPDGLMVRGVPYILRLPAGLRRPRHGVRGTEVAGTVTKAGVKVADWHPGDEVFGWCGRAAGAGGGGFAEYARCPANMVARKPATISFEEAAAIPTNGVTALQAVRDWARVQPGQHVLVNGAAGGVGTFAVQITKAFGAEATGVCSTRNVDFVRSLGADAVIDYTREDFTRGARRYDVILDFPHYATHSLTQCRHALAPRGTFIPASNTRNRWVGGFSRVIRAQLASPFVQQRMSAPTMAQIQADLITVAGLIEAGKVTPVIDRTYPLAEAPEAIRYFEQGHTRGKIIITV